jgi:hypothetical protein
MKFEPFPKMARLTRPCIVTEKIDGTNASIFIGPSDGSDPNLISEYYAEDVVLGIWAGSRTRWITPSNDNFGFAQWVKDNATELFKLGEGHHFGEWWGKGIQRGYGLNERRFSLFNASRWIEHDKPTYAVENNNPKAEQKFTERAPACCKVVPILYRGPFDTDIVDIELDRLTHYGSVAADGFMKPEGVVVYHTAGNVGFKKTIEDDGAPKSFIR